MASITIHGVSVPVALMEGDLLDHVGKGDHLCGACNADCGILLRAEMYPGEIAATLLHESIHRAFPAMEEDSVVALERWLPGFITSNGGPIDWLHRIVAEAQAEYDAENADEGEEDLVL